ncbi:eif-3.C [Symbiodinium microadriaticum]|nr:eif-3.C [Symbiodinium microadriaticum]
MAGDLAKAVGFILGMDVWNLIPNDGCQKVKAMLSIRLKEEALRIYLLSAVSANYQSLCLSHVCSLFDMELPTGRRIISRMIFHSELAGAWDRSHDGEDVLVLHKVEATSVQTLALQVAEKMTMLVESNERMLDPMTGAYGYKDEWVGRNRQQQEDRQGGRSAANKGWKGTNMRGGSGGHGGSRTSGGGRGRGGSGRGGGGANWSNQTRSTGNKTFANKAGQPKDSISKKTSVAGWGNVGN